MLKCFLSADVVINTIHKISFTCIEINNRDYKSIATKANIKRKVGTKIILWISKRGKLGVRIRTIVEIKSLEGFEISKGRFCGGLKDMEDIGDVKIPLRVTSSTKGAARIFLEFCINNHILINMNFLTEG
jgi:hypothetical protein